MSRPRLWRLAPWTRAPLLGLRQPAAVLAVLVTTAILACAVASAPLFLSSARSGALQQQLAQQCAEAGWGQTGAVVQQSGRNGAPTGARLDGAAVESALAQGWQQTGHDSVPVMTTGVIGSRDNSPAAGLVRDPAGKALSIPGTVFYRPGATDDVERVDGGGGSGVWVPRSYAEQGGIAVGDTITVAESAVVVAGLYTDLFSTSPSSAWCDYRVLYANDTNANTPPPALLLATDQETFDRLSPGFPVVTALRQVPVDPTGLSVSDVDALLADQARAQAALPPTTPGDALPGFRLADSAGRAELIERGLRGPVVPVAVAGALLALVLVAAAGSFWADRRATEVRLLAARGVGPVPLAGKAALELGLPALVGAALGWAVSRLLIAGLGPADDIDPSAVSAAVGAGAAAFVVGLGAAALVAGLRARSTAERPLGAAARWPARVPWELALLAAAGGCWALLQGRDAVVSEGNVAQVNGLLVAFPLLAVAGAAVLLGRLVTAALPRLRRWAGSRSPAVFLAVNRLGAARLATGTLLVAVTLPVAVLGYTATLTASSQHTLDAKIGVQIGAGAVATTISRLEPTPEMLAAGAYVVRYEGSTGPGTVPDSRARGRPVVQVLAVDPAHFADTAFWDDSFADESLPELMAALQGPEVDGRLPVVAAGVTPGDPDLQLGTVPVPAQVVAQARVLPGRRANAPLVMVDASRLPEIQRGTGSERSAEIWVRSDLAPAVEALADAGATGIRTIEPAEVTQRANFLGITWTFGYLSALAVFVGVIAVGGLLLYLEARSRTRVSGYVMARRLGLGRGAHLRSLLVELTGVAVVGSLLGGVLAAGAVALVYRRLDVDLLRPPTPLLDVPWSALAGSVVVVLVVACLAALYAQRAADRADPASVLREDA